MLVDLEKKHYLCIMNQMSTLVEYLLLNHDYVVIPGLGTFIVQQIEAARNEVDDEILPPYRSVRFNANLMHGDDLVVRAISDIYNLTEQQAGQRLGEWVTEITQTLEDEGCVDFGAIGIFTSEDGKDIQFTAHDAGVTTPEYYGLDTFHFASLDDKKVAKVVPITASMEADEKAIVIRINRRIANFVAAACAAILLFIVFNSPTQYGNGFELRSSIQELLFPTTPGLNIQPAASEEENTTATEKTEPASTPQETVEQPIAKEEYYIVLASAISMENATRYVNTLSSRGFVSARIVSNGSMNRVVVGHFNTEEEANDAAREIRQRSSEYRSAWVHHS